MGNIATKEILARIEKLYYFNGLNRKQITNRFNLPFKKLKSNTVYYRKYPVDI